MTEQDKINAGAGECTGSHEGCGPHAACDEDKAAKGWDGMTKKQKKAVRRELRAVGRGEESRWSEVIREVLDHYDREDPVCGDLLRMRYLQEMPEELVYPRLYIGRTTYYRKELEALSTVAVYAAAAGLMDP